MRSAAGSSPALRPNGSRTTNFLRSDILGRSAQEAMGSYYNSFSYSSSNIPRDKIGNRPTARSSIFYVEGNLVTRIIMPTYTETRYDHRSISGGPAQISNNIKPISSLESSVPYLCMYAAFVILSQARHRQKTGIKIPYITNRYSAFPHNRSYNKISGLTQILKRNSYRATVSRTVITLSGRYVVYGAAWGRSSRWR